MNYIVTGGSGFIGTHLINLLKEVYPDCNIYNLDIVENCQDGKATYINCDVRKPIDLKDVVITVRFQEMNMLEEFLADVIAVIFQTTILLLKIVSTKVRL